MSPAILALKRRQYPQARRILSPLHSARPCILPALAAQEFFGHNVAMPNLTLYTLHLASPLYFEAFDACPGTSDTSSTVDSVGTSGQDSGAAIAAAALRALSHEGDEILLAFAPENFVYNDENNGPLLVRPLRAPFFCGKKKAREHSDRADAHHGATLPRGSYAFMQWRAKAAADSLGMLPSDSLALALTASLYEGLEHYIRAIWWEGYICVGPWYFRALQEDGNIALQALRIKKN